MKIVYFILIVTVAAFCGALAGSLISYAVREGKRKKRRTMRAGRYIGNTGEAADR